MGSIMIRPVAKFTGKYRDLIPMGFEFQKLFGANYRCYKKGFGICDESIRIWQKGNDVEIMDFYQKTGWLIAKFVKNRELIPQILFHGSLWAKMNTKTGEMERSDQWSDLERIKKREDAARKADKMDEYYKTWKDVHIEMDMITEVLRLYDEGLIVLVDKEFPEK
jgi:hypothetical protein